MNKAAIFWTDPRNLGWMRSELRLGRLRQGWGYEGCQLCESGRLIPFEQWAQNYAAGAYESWGLRVSDEHLRTRYGILTRMLQLERGDHLVIPNMPDSGFMTLARVRGGYRSDSSHFDKVAFSKKANSRDFIHVVDVYPANLAEVAYDSSIDAQFVASKFSNYRSAVNFVRQPAYRAAIDRLFQDHLPG